MSQQWNATLYDHNHSFVWRYGESLLEWLAPQAGESILDLGCGTGHLTHKIAETGAIVTGMDADPAMIGVAQQTYPHLTFKIADGRNFQVSTPIDAIFSNATLHWIQPPDAVIHCMAQALKPGGRLVAEFGGKGNIQTIATALFATLQQLGYYDCETYNPWYFPSIAEYATRLERHGLAISHAILFDRPTRLADREAGMRNWLEMFASGIFSHISVADRSQVIQRLEECLKPELYRGGEWMADYRRLRLFARKR